MSLEQKIEYFFRRRPDLSEVYSTEDNLLFSEYHKAQAHAQGLQNKTVKTNYNIKDGTWRDIEIDGVMHRQRKESGIWTTYQIWGE